MPDRDDEKRLVISTFIIATTIALMFSQTTIEVDRSSWLTYVIGTLLIGLCTSAAFAVVHIMTKGYELRHSKKTSKWVNKLSAYTYNLSVSAYLWVMSIILLTLIFEYVSNIPEYGDVYAKSGMAILALILVFFATRKDLLQIIRGVKKRKRKN